MPKALLAAALTLWSMTLYIKAAWPALRGDGLQMGMTAVVSISTLAPSSTKPATSTIFAPCARCQEPSCPLWAKVCSG